MTETKQCLSCPMCSVSHWLPNVEFVCEHNHRTAKTEIKKLKEALNVIYSNRKK